MALNDLFGMFNDKLEEVFHRPAWDANAARKPLLKGIKTAREQFEAGRTKAPNRWWTVSNDVVALEVKVGGKTFDLNGKKVNHLPSDSFVPFLDKFKEKVEAGEFDEELKNGGEGDASVVIPKARKRAPMSDAAKENMRQAALRREAAKKAAAEA